MSEPANNGVVAWAKSLEETAAKPIKRSNYVERSHAIADDLQTITFQLYNLSKAHSRLGMDTVAAELFDMAERLRPNLEALRSMVGDILDEQLAEATGNNAAMLRAVLGRVDG